MKVFTTAISWLLMPLLIPAIAIGIVLFLPTEISFTDYNSLYYWNIDAKKYLTGLFFFFGFVLPGFSVYILRYSGMVKSVELETQRERSIPLVLTAVYTVFLIVLLYKLSATTIISAHLFGLAYSGLAMAAGFAIANQFIKISLHGGGAGMLLSFVLAYSIDQPILIFWPLYLVIFLAALILFARLYLQKHTPKEIYFGFILGSLLTFASDYVCVQFF